MALYKVDASFIPRQFEVQTRCLMTIPWDQSGNDVALTIELSETPELEVYTFLRSTSSSFSDSQTALMPFGFGGCSLDCDGAALDSPCSKSHPAESVALGECSESRRISLETESWNAPKEPKVTPLGSTTTPVDIAGWTQVVIQRGRYVLLAVRKGQSMAMVNASINGVAEAGLSGQLQLSLPDDVTFSNGTSGCPGLTKMNYENSCPNNFMR
jgi:hypothetical protein